MAKRSPGFKVIAWLNDGRGRFTVQQPAHSNGLSPDTMIADALQSHLEPDRREQVPQPEADRSQSQDDNADFNEPRQAPDGHHYIKRGGQHFQVDVGAMNGATGA